jgi:hypothetical protein
LRIRRLQVKLLPRYSGSNRLGAPLQDGDHVVLMVMMA